MEFFCYHRDRPGSGALRDERVEVELFVAVMGASNYTYAEATASQRSHDWIASHVRLVEFLGGVPDVFVRSAQERRRDPQPVRAGDITVRLVIARAIARWLPRCPACHTKRRRSGRLGRTPL